MTDQYQKRDINNGENFFFREFLPTDPVIPPFPFPSQQISPETQLALFDTSAIAGIALLPSALSAGPNGMIVIAVGPTVTSLTITSVFSDTFLVAVGFNLFITASNVASTFRSNGIDSWIGVSQTS
jgi:hypothetical protein